jgi:hypothetical protein
VLPAHPKTRSQWSLLIEDRCYDQQPVIHAEYILISLAFQYQYGYKDDMFIAWEKEYSIQN